MEVVNFNGEIYLADIIELKESHESISYNRTYAFYDYDTIKKLDGMSLDEEELNKYILFTHKVTGTELPFKKVTDIQPIKVETKIVKIRTMTIKVGKPITKYTFDE